jgi:ABC-type glutathione transport system ATPase component
MPDQLSPSTGRTPLLVASNLSKEFGSARVMGGRRSRSTIAVSGVSFELFQGETLAIVGESGSGKSTLARMLLNLIEPTHGEVTFEGEVLTAKSARDMRAARRHIQMIFQDPYASLHPRRTVAQSITEGWRIHPGIEDRANYRNRVAELLGQVGLPTDYANLNPLRLSGGERQRVAIARALALRPKLLVLDEPVSALDVSIQAQVIRLLMTLQQELGLTYVFISHDLALVRLLADRVIVMYHGEIVDFGATDDVYLHPTSDYTRRLLDSTPSALLQAAAAVADEEPTRALRGHSIG